jgi:HAD domain in Swiss Army Knife RNA repair proteins
MQPKERVGGKTEGSRPLLMVDIDGVISLFGTLPARPGAPHGIEGSFHSIDGMPHFLSSTAAAHLLALSSLFDLVWASGWEEKADEHLPHLLGLPSALPFLRFPRAERGSQITHGHWKLESIGAYAAGRPLAWIDDALSPACHQWAAARSEPTLLVQTQPEHGLTALEAQLLQDWARALAAQAR